MYGLNEIMYFFVLPSPRLRWYIEPMARRRTRPVVLVVDDEAMVRGTLRDILQEDYEVLEAADARSAIDVARVAPVDVVLLDICLPGISGLDALPQLRLERPTAAIIVISGVDRARTAVEALKLGADNYLTKPFDIDVLADAISTALRRARRAHAESALPRRSSVALVGCSPGMVAGLGATLTEQLDVHGYREPPPPETFAALGPPSLFVVETLEHRPDWLDRAAPIAERFCPAHTIVLGDDTAAIEARFWFGEGCVFLRHPFPLTTLLEVVCNMLSDAPARRSWHDERTAKVIDAVAGGYADFRLRRFARTLGMAPYRLSGSFKHRMGASLNTYLTRVRVYAARYLLEQHGLKVEAVARKVGFHDASHLSSAFRRVLGSRPGPHRRGRPEAAGPQVSP